MVKKTLLYIFAFMMFFGFNQNQTIKAEDTMPNTVKVHFFTDQYCTNCAQIDKYLNDLKGKEKLPIEIIKYDTNDSDPVKREESKELMFDVIDALKAIDEGAANIMGTPFVVIGGKYYNGSNATVRLRIKNYIKKYEQEPWLFDLVEMVKDGETLITEHLDFDDTLDYMDDLPIIGVVDIRDVSLLLMTILIGAVDGFNPCAMGVLIFLIGMLIKTKDRKRMWILGLTFLLTSAAFYFLILMSWITIASQFLQKFWFQLIIGMFALGFGAYSIYKYFKSLKSDDGCEVVDDTKRKRIFENIKKFISEKKYPIAMAGIIAVAVVVNLIELACSTGLPVIYAEVLAINGVAGSEAIMYTLIYILFFLIDDLIVFAIAMFTMKVVGMSNRYTKYSHLIGGLIMLAIGILMVFFPNILAFNF